MILYADHDDRLDGTRDGGNHPPPREAGRVQRRQHGITPESVRKGIGDILDSVYERDHVLVSTGGGLAGIGEFEDAATIGHNFEAVIADLETRMREAAADLELRGSRACATSSSACAPPSWR